MNKIKTIETNDNQMAIISELEESDERTTNTIYQKILNITEELGAVKKDSTNGFHKYNYRSVDAVMNQLHPLLIKHKVLVYPSVESREHKILEGKSCSVTGIIKFTFVDAETGESFVASVLAEGLDNGDKASYKAMSGAIKYALFHTLMIPTEDDPDKDSHVLEKKWSNNEIVGTALVNEKTKYSDLEVEKVQDEDPLNLNDKTKEVTISVDGKTYDIDQARSIVLRGYMKVFSYDEQRSTEEFELKFGTKISNAAPDLCLQAIDYLKQHQKIQQKFKNKTTEKV